MSGPRDALADLRGALAGLLEDVEGRRLWLIANSPGDHAQRVAERLDPARDLLVQYNHCEHHAGFDDRGIPCLFFVYINAQGWPNGLDGETVQQPFHAYPAGSRVYFLREAATAGPERDRQLEAAASRIDLPSQVLCTDYLRSRVFATTPGCIPSAGFTSILLIHLANTLRACDGRAPHRMGLSGFTGDYGGKAYFRHDIFGEQALARTLPNLEVLSPTGDLVLPGDAATAPVARYFRELFSRYDGQAKDKAEVLFDLAKVAYALDLDPEFFRLLREAITANPWKGVYYLREAIAIARDHPERLAHLGLPVGGQGQTAADLDALNLRLRFHGFAREGPPLRWDFGPDGAFGPLLPGRGRRVLILNDSSLVVTAKHHLGAFVASRQLHAALAAQGLVAAGCANTLVGLGKVLRLGGEGSFDGAILYGAGALQGDSERGFELLQMAACLHDLGKPVFLLGATWRNNTHHLARYCRHFDAVAVRDGESLAQIRRVRPDARLVPDICWLGTAAAGVPVPRIGVGVQDSAVEAQAAQLEGLADTRGLDFFVMARFAQRVQGCVMQGRPLERIPAVLTEADLGRYGGWVSGRLQGSILALRRGAGVAAASNTGTALGALFADIGLDDKILGPRPLAAAARPGGADASLANALDYGLRDWRKVDAYADLARSENARLCQDLAAALR